MQAAATSPLVLHRVSRDGDDDDDIDGKPPPPPPHIYTHTHTLGQFSLSFQRGVSTSVHRLWFHVHPLQVAEGRGVDGGDCSSGPWRSS